MGAPLTAPPGLGVLRPPPLPRRGPPRLRAGTGWCGERRGADESPGRRRAAPPSLFPGGRAGPGGWWSAPVAAVTSVHARVPSLWSRRQGEGS